MAWTVETLTETVDAELAELPPDMRARLVRMSELIESVDLPSVKESHVRDVRGQLWEIRLKGKAGNRTRAVHHCTRAARRERQSLHQEDREDAHEGDRSGAAKS